MQAHPRTRGSTEHKLDLKQVADSERFRDVDEEHQTIN
jgi:hypothetical protein